MELSGEAKDRFIREISKVTNSGIKQCIVDHGPITHLFIASASKRIAVRLAQHLMHWHPDVLHDKIKRINRSGVTKLSDSVSIDLP